MRQSYTRREHTQASAIILFVLIVLVTLAFVTMATRSYRGVVDSRNEANHSRATFSFVNTQLRSVASASLLTRRDGPQGPMLVMADGEGSAFETRIYLYDDALLEEYASTNTPINPDGATKVADLSSFDFSVAADGTVHVWIDGAEHLVFLQGGGAMS